MKTISIFPNIELTNPTSRFCKYVNGLCSWIRVLLDLHTHLLIHSWSKHRWAKNACWYVTPSDFFIAWSCLLWSSYRIILKLMAKPNWLQNCAYTPHAVDNLGDGSRTDELTAFKGSYQNSAYENSKIAHRYEDPSPLAEKVLSSRGRARRLRKSDERENYNDADFVGDPWLSRLILFLILAVSLTSLLLVVLITLSKVEPGCSCNEEAEQGKSVFRLDLLKVGSLCSSSLVIRKKFETFFTTSAFLQERMIVYNSFGQFIVLCHSEIYGTKNRLYHASNAWSKVL